MAKWGNALGGYRKQRRAKNGQFGSGAGSAKKVTKKAASKKKPSSRAMAKSASAQRKKVPKKKLSPTQKNAARDKEHNRRADFHNESYGQAGGIYRQRRDILLSQGAYANRKNGSKATAGTKIAAVGRSAAIGYVAPSAIVAPVVGVSYLRHRQHIKGKSNNADFTLSNKKMSAKTKKRLVVGAAVIGAAVATYGTHQYIQDKKFEAQPGITLYHNTHRNLKRDGFHVNDRIKAGYGDDYVFLSNTNNGLARTFGSKQYRIKYNGDMGAIMRDHAEDGALLANGGGEKFFMIPQANLQGAQMRRTTSFRQSRKGRYHGETMTNEAKRRSKDEFGSKALGKLHAYQAANGEKIQREILGGNSPLHILKATNIQRQQVKRQKAAIKRAAVERMVHGATKNSASSQARKAARQSGVSSPAPQGTSKAAKAQSHKDRLRAASVYDRNQRVAATAASRASAGRRRSEANATYAANLFKIQNPGASASAVSTYKNRARRNGFAG